MTASVIIPAYNASLTIARSLEAILTQNYSSPYEIIVVDDGSKDNTSSIVRAFDRVVYLYQENAGPAAARNKGAQIAKGQFLCFTDSDCIPHVDWIKKMLGAFRTEDIGVVSGSYGIANPERALARGIHAEIIFRHTRLMSDFPRSFGSYNFCVRKAVFDQVGGFKSDYRQASGEDNDLSYRVLDKKYRIYFERKALVDHYHTDRVWKYLKEQFRHGFWRVNMYVDHPKMVGGDDYTFWKDALEVPWAGCCLAGIILCGLGVLKFLIFLKLFLLPFLIFEVFFALCMRYDFFSGIFFGFVMFLRAFARAFGLSTGIICFFVKKLEKKFK